MPFCQGPVVLGLPRLRTHNPPIGHVTGAILALNPTCQQTCWVEEPAVAVASESTADSDSGVILISSVSPV